MHNKTDATQTILSAKKAKNIQNRKIVISDNMSTL